MDSAATGLLAMDTDPPNVIVRAMITPNREPPFPDFSIAERDRSEHLDVALHEAAVRAAGEAAVSGEDVEAREGTAT